VSTLRIEADSFEATLKAARAALESIRAVVAGLDVARATAEARSLSSTNGKLKNGEVPNNTAVSMPSRSMSFSRCTGSVMPVVACG